jgi:hypothetical protein
MSAIHPMKLDSVKKLLARPLGLYSALLIVFAFNLSSHTFAFWPGDNWWLRSFYWLVYLSMSLCFIFGFYYLLERSGLKWSKHLLFALAVAISWLPFGLCISMIDIATSRPATSYAIRELQSTGFLPTLIPVMAVNILPRHLMFGFLIYIIRFYVNVNNQAEPTGTSPLADSGENEKLKDQKLVMQAGFVDKLSAKVKAEPQLLQAQEHYVQVTTALGQELILYKFGQAIREIPEHYGIQVHRSYWVAKGNIKGWSIVDNGVKIVLHHGEQAPVSRRFEHYIKQNFSEIA